MREILFKAKRLDNGEWIYWNIYGELCRESGKRERLSIKKGATTHYYDYINQVYQIIDIKTICQYTGLTDKNRRKIWENDVVKIAYFDVSDEIGWIKYSNCGMRYYFVVGTEIYSIDDSCDIEVIGNTFDNPELIGGMEC